MTRPRATHRGVAMRVGLFVLAVLLVGVGRVVLGVPGTLPWWQDISGVVALMAAGAILPRICND
jgi:hypothetical protein